MNPDIHEGMNSKNYMQKKERKSERRGVFGGGGRGCLYYCNRVHLHIVFVLLFVLWVCRSVGVLSCVYVSRSFTYALRVVI